MVHTHKHWCQLSRFRRMRVLIGTLAFVFAGCMANAQWCKLGENHTDIGKLDMVSENTGYHTTTMGYVGRSVGYVKKTTDGGRTWWTDLEYDFTGPGGGWIRDIHMIDTSSGWACGRVDNPQRTDNDRLWRRSAVPDVHGNYWQPKFIGGGESGVERVWGFDTLNAIAAGRSRWLYRTTDGGESWRKLALLNYFAHALQFVTSTSGFVLTPDSLYITTDGGERWGHVGNLPAGFYLSFKAYSIRDFWIGDIDGKVHRTTNGGVSWSTSRVSMHRIEDLEVVDENTAWAVIGGHYDSKSWSDSVRAYQTTDGGMTWRAESGLPNCWINDVEVLGSDRVYIAGACGTLVTRCDVTSVQYDYEQRSALDLSPRAYDLLGRPVDDLYTGMVITKLGATGKWTVSLRR